MAEALTNEEFHQQIRTVRDDYWTRRDSTNLVPPGGPSVAGFRIELIDATAYHTYWHENGNDAPQCVRLADIPGTLSGEILRLKRILPERHGNYEIVGDQIRPLEQALPLPEEEPNDFEDTEQILKLLPLVQVDCTKHFTKQCKYKSEVQNLLKCQGGSCPGKPISEHIVQLLGKSLDGKLVFENLKPSIFVFSGQFHSSSTYLGWVQQLVSGLQSLHSQGIVHRDLRLANVVFSEDSSKLVIIDLEGRWGNRLAPELTHDSDLNAGWSEKSDIYDVGIFIRNMILGSNPINDKVELPVPAPLDRIVEACTNPSPEQRPSLLDLHRMVSELLLQK